MHASSRWTVSNVASCSGMKEGTVLIARPAEKLGKHEILLSNLLPRKLDNAMPLMKKKRCYQAPDSDQQVVMFLLAAI